MNPRIYSLTDDLTLKQFVELLEYLCERLYIGPEHIKHWRKKVGLPVDRED